MIIINLKLILFFINYNSLPKNREILVGSLLIFVIFMIIIIKHNFHASQYKDFHSPFISLETFLCILVAVQPKAEM